MSYPPFAGVDTYGQPLVDAWWTRGWTAQNKDYLVAPAPGEGMPGSPSATYVNIVHGYYDGDNSPLSGFLTFMPTSSANLTQGSSTWRIPARLSGTTTFSPYAGGWGWHQDSSGEIYLFQGGLYVSLLATDTEGLVTDSGDPLTYMVIEHFEGGQKFQISVPSDSADPVELYSLMITGTLAPYVYDPTNVLADECAAPINYAEQQQQQLTDIDGGNA